MAHDALQRALYTLAREMFSRLAISEPPSPDRGVRSPGLHQWFETLTMSGRERNSVRISSEDQLESLTSSLYLAVYRLSELPESDQSMSLNDLVMQIEGDLADAQALEELSRKLSAYGYAPLHDYDSPRFMISDLKTYRVVEGFPRLVRSGIPNGIARLSYDIQLETIRPFECSSSEILRSA